MATQTNELPFFVPSSDNQKAKIEVKVFVKCCLRREINKTCLTKQ